MFPHHTHTMSNWFPGGPQRIRVGGVPSIFSRFARTASFQVHRYVVEQEAPKAVYWETLIGRRKILFPSVVHQMGI